MWSSFSIGPRSAIAVGALELSAAAPWVLVSRWQACKIAPTELRLSPRPRARTMNSRRGMPPDSSCCTRRSTSLRLLTRAPPVDRVDDLLRIGRSAVLLPQPIPHSIVPSDERKEPGHPGVTWDRAEALAAEIGNRTATGEHIAHSRAQVRRQGYTVSAVPHCVVHPAVSSRMR